MTRQIITCMCCIGVVACFGQETTEKLMRIEGRIVDGGYQPVPYAHVLILESLYGVAGDIFGCFSIGAYPGDTLTITAVSYHRKKYIVPSSLTAQELPVTFILEQDTVMLAEQEVYAWPERDRQRTEAINRLIDQELVTALDHLTPSYKDLLVSQVYFTGAGVSIPGPLSLIYSTFSKEAKTRRELKKIILKERVRKRYTNDLISKITGIRSASDINRFISYCALEDRFILNSSDYELYSAIMQCYDAFRKEKP